MNRLCNGQGRFVGGLPSLEWHSVIRVVLYSNPMTIRIPITEVMTSDSRFLLQLQNLGLTKNFILDLFCTLLMYDYCRFHIIPTVGGEGKMQKKQSMLKIFRAVYIFLLDMTFAPVPKTRPNVSALSIVPDASP